MTAVADGATVTDMSTTTTRQMPAGFLDNYADAGFDSVTADAWFGLNFYPGEAARWAAAGFTAAEADAAAAVGLLNADVARADVRFSR